MATISVYNARAEFSRLIERALAGEEIVITRRGKAVARLVPAAARHDPESVIAVFRRLRERGRGAPKFDWAEWRRYVDEGRP
jgi:prevent-host-death family protein